MKSWHTVIYMPRFSITSTIHNYPTTIPYETIKNDILGKRYTLSLTFVGTKRAQTINQQSRQKDYAPNVLSFPLEKDYGDIMLCPAVADREARAFGMTKTGYLAFLYIHGLLHLKGYDHGDTMEKLERRYVRKYGIA